MDKVSLGVVDRHYLADIVQETILERIRSGQFKEGDKLPSERDLAMDLGVSRSSLRDALRSLELMGYIRSKVGSGNYVASVTVDRVVAPFSAMMAQDHELAVDVICVRQVLEEYTAGLAAKNAAKKHIKSMSAAIESMSKELLDGGIGVESDNLFHLEIARASGNRALSLFSELLCEALSDSRKATLSIPGQPAKTREDHLAILAAIRDHDEERAKLMMREHLVKAHRNLESGGKGGKR